MPEPLRRSDYLLLAAFVGLLFSVSLAAARVLGNHETIHCQNVREMLADGDYMIPHCGGRPWLERPPLPFWITLPFVAAFGDSPLVFRLVSLLVALPTVLLTGWMAGMWFGRGVGLLSGCALATLQEFHRYALAPESDIFVCSLVCAGMAIFAHLEFQRRPDGRGSFMGSRPWAVLACFVVLGVGNMVKGLYFVDLHLLVPAGLFLLWRPAPWNDLRRYIWLPGWIVFVVIGGAWAMGAYARHPDIVALWSSDYNGRITEGYMREPWWYYLANLPASLLPWTPLALAGLWLTRREALGKAGSPERFLWCWAIAPAILLSIPKGKHHHYLLAAMAPWAVLAALAAGRAHAWLAGRPRHRLAFALIALVAAGEAGVLAAWRAHPRLEPWVPFAVLACPLLGGAAWLSARQADAARGLGVLVAACVLMHWAKEHPEWGQQAGHRGDLAFVEKIKAECAGEVLVLDRWGPLDASWSLYHLKGRGRLLHNITFMRDDRLGDGDLLVLSRPFQMEGVEEFGRCEVVARSGRSRGEKEPAHRLTLYRVRLHPHVARVSGAVYISPMQATGRAEGPEALTPHSGCIL